MTEAMSIRRIGGMPNMKTLLGARSSHTSSVPVATKAGDSVSGSAPGPKAGNIVSDSAPSPALLTSYIKKAWTIEALFHTYSAHQSQLNHAHLAAIWSSLGQLAKAGTDQYWFQEHAKALESLVQHTMRTVST